MTMAGTGSLDLGALNAANEDRGQKGAARAREVRTSAISGLIPHAICGKDETARLALTPSDRDSAGTKRSWESDEGGRPQEATNIARPRLIPTSTARRHVRRSDSCHITSISPDSRVAKDFSGWVRYFRNVASRVLALIAEAMRSTIATSERWCLAENEIET